MRASNKIWLLTYEHRFVYIDKKSDRLDWKAAHTFHGMVKHMYRKSSKGGKWRYSYFGNTQQEACNRYNHNTLCAISDLETRIQILKAVLISPED